jgi:gluconate 2-dehydrogenase gamma chain
MKQSVPPNSEAVNDGDQRPKEKPIAVSRRGFLRAAGLAAVSAASVGTLNGCETAPEATTPAAAPSMAELQPVAPYPPAEPPSLGTLQFFNLHEAQMVEALTARILPGTPEDPGAREAGVVYYIDNLLAHPDGFVEPTYHRPPFAQTYQGDEPPANAAGDYQIIWVPEAEIERYGYQAIFTPRETFRMGLAAIDRYARAQFEHDFAALSEEQQDQVITALVDGTATGFEPLSPKAFFQVLRRYTGEGSLATRPMAAIATWLAGSCSATLAHSAPTCQTKCANPAAVLPGPFGAWPTCPIFTPVWKQATMRSCLSAARMAIMGTRRLNDDAKI